MQGAAQASQAFTEHQHRELKRGIDHIHDVACGIEGWVTPDLAIQVRDLLRWLDRELEPHVAWEDSFLYPEIDARTGSPWATRAARFDHWQVRQAAARVRADEDLLLRGGAPELLSDSAATCSASRRWFVRTSSERSASSSRCSTRTRGSPASSSVLDERRRREARDARVRLARSKPRPEAASRMLANLGFLASSDLPDRPGPAYLLVALRPEPTLRHYDPERVDYWATMGGGGTRQVLTRHTRLPLRATFSWGLIRIVDRLHVSNEYLTFGGELAAECIDGNTSAVFTSPAPLLRRGGHSQGWDHGAETVGGFFGRLLVAVDYVPGFEGRLGQAKPVARYAAFVADTVGRYPSEPRAPCRPRRPLDAHPGRGASPAA